MAQGSQRPNNLFPRFTQVLRVSRKVSTRHVLGDKQHLLTAQLSQFRRFERRFVYLERLSQASYH